MKKLCATTSVVLLFAICGTSMGAETKVATDELERQLHASLVEQGRPADSIDCPDELDKDKGAKAECTALVSDLESILKVTFNGIDGDLINIQVTEEPKRVTPDGLANMLKAYAEQRGTGADFIDCPNALDADKGSQVECAIVHNNLGYSATVTSNGPDGNTVDVRFVVTEGPNWWPRDWLVHRIQAVLTERTDAPADSVDCPDDLLDAGDGSEVECTFVRNGLEFTATLMAKGGSVDYRSADDPSRMTQKGLEAHVTQTMTGEGGRNPGNVACPEEGLVTKIGETQRCLVTTGADLLDVTVTVTSVGGGTMGMDLNIGKGGRAKGRGGN